MVLSLNPYIDLSEFQKHLSDFPSDWINGYDKKQMIDQKNLYDLKAIPTLYLLDKDKTVLLKDATAEEIEEYLQKNIWKRIRHSGHNKEPALHDRK